MLPGDRTLWFAVIGNKLLNITSGKWQWINAGVIKNIGFHHDFGMITSPDGAAQILLCHFERPNCRISAQLAG
ncbi:MAG: hypothetical protein B7X50_08870 [Alishewanella sp. 34-51-39]|nr:MAG: hypothetical protein B7X50_08870 [Alishewanella sp. 34-51-39]